MREAANRSVSTYSIQQPPGLVARMEDFAAKRAAIPYKLKNIDRALRRGMGQERLVAKLTEQVPEDVVVAAGLALVGGATPEPYRINAGLELLGSEKATWFIGKQSDLFDQTLKTYEQLKEQQLVLASQQAHRQPHAYAPSVMQSIQDPNVANDVRIRDNLRRLRLVVIGHNDKRQAVEKVLYHPHASGY